MDWSIVIAAGLVNWLVTTIIVEGAVFVELRAWVDAHLPAKLGYLVHCHLCSGTWVGFALGAIIPGPFSFGYLTWALNGFLYKAVGHVTLELTALAKNTNAIKSEQIQTARARRAPHG